MYCRRLLESFRVVARVGPDGEFEFHCRTGGTDDAPITVKLPERSDPFRLFAAFEKAHPESKLLDAVVYAHALFSKNYERFTLALSVADRFDERFPKSPWRSDVAALVQEITHPVINVETVPTVLPGKSHEFSFTTRNIPKLGIDVYKIDFDEIYSSRSYLDDDEASLSDVEAVIEAVGLRRVAAVHPSCTSTPRPGTLDATSFMREKPLSLCPQPAPI